MQLAQVQALRTCIISGAFKATFIQVLNIDTYLILIGFKLDKKVDQIAA